MANYTFLDAYSSIKTAASSTIGGVEYPIVKIPDTITASVNGTVTVIGNPSVSGTVNIVFSNPSIVGTYIEDAAHATGDKGLFGLGVRNDTLASVTSADNDYSPFAVGAAGEAITANAPLTKWVQGSSSVFYGSSVQVIAAQGASIFTYVTAVQAANNSANNVYLTFFGGTSSIIGYLPIPANSGAIPLMINGWKTNANQPVMASVSGVASVFLSAQGFISKV